MRRLFGSAPEPKGPAPSLSDASAKIDGRVSNLDEKIAKCDEDLKRLMAGGKSRNPADKKRALDVLRRKKMYEQQRDQAVGQQFNVDSLAFAQEQVEVTMTSVAAMKAGHQDLKAQYQQLDIGDVERLMDDMADLADEAAEINEAISQSYAVPDGFDEADLDAEFESLEEECRMDALAGITAPAAPSRPAYLPAGQEATGSSAEATATPVAEPSAASAPPASG